jgi:hypothetical protein
MSLALKGNFDQKNQSDLKIFFQKLPLEVADKLKYPKAKSLKEAYDILASDEADVRARQEFESTRRHDDDHGSRRGYNRGRSRSRDRGASRPLLRIRGDDDDVVDAMDSNLYYTRKNGPPPCDHTGHDENDCWKQRLCADCGFYGHSAQLGGRCSMCQICPGKVFHKANDSCPNRERARRLVAADQGNEGGL